LLGPSHTFADTRMRMSVPPEEKKNSVLFLIHVLFIVVLPGIDTRI